MSASNNEDSQVKVPATRMDILKKEVSNIENAMKKDCFLFFTLGQEITSLIRDVYKKDMELLTQNDRIELLTKAIVILYSKLKEYLHVTYKYIDELDNTDNNISLKKVKIEEFRCTLKGFKKDMGFSKHTSFSESRNYCSERVMELENECIELKNDIVRLNAEGSKYLMERDELEEKLKDSMALVENLSTKHLSNRDSLAGDLESLKRDHRSSLNQVLSLSAENRAQNDKIEILEESLRQNSAMHSSIGNVQNNSMVFDRRSKSRSSITWTTESGSERCDDKPPLKTIRFEDQQDRINELVEALAKEHRDRCIERTTRNQEMLNLKEAIIELEKALRDAQNRADFLQNSVDASKTTIHALECYEDKSKTEVQTNMECICELSNILVSIGNHCSTYIAEVADLNNYIESLLEINLNLEVENFEHVQDVAMLETRVLKYQRSCKSDEDCICNLKSELNRLGEEASQLSTTNTYLKQQLAALTCEHHAVQKIALESQEIQSRLEKTNEKLNHKLGIAKQDLMRETSINDCHNGQIEELQQILREKCLEMGGCECELNKVRTKLDGTLHENNKLKAEVAQLLNEMKKYQHEGAVLEQRTDQCNKEIASYKNNLLDVKDKLVKVNAMLEQKREQFSHLETEFCVQNNMLACAKQQIECNRAHYDSELASLKNTIKDLNDKLAKAENAYHKLNADYKKNQVQSLEEAQREAKMQNDYVRRDKEITDQLQRMRLEDVRLNEYILQLEAESSTLRNELSNKDQQVVVAQEEMNSLKDEVNKVIHRHGKLKCEHEKLQTQLCKLQENTSNCEEKSQIAICQLQQYSSQLSAVQTEKNRMDIKNKQLKKELQTTRTEYHELEKTHRILKATVATLEMEIVDNKMSRDEICTESRNVITNVRAWLQDQICINGQLSQKHTEYEEIIKRLKEKITKLQTKSCKCKCSCRQRGGGGSNGSQQLEAFGVVGTNERMLWSPGSRGTNSASPSSLISSNEDWYSYEEFDVEGYAEDPSLLNNCLRKVESINQELQRSNQYWQSKMPNNDYLVTRDPN